MPQRGALRRGAARWTGEPLIGLRPETALDGTCAERAVSCCLNFSRWGTCRSGVNMSYFTIATHILLSISDVKGRPVNRPLSSVSNGNVPYYKMSHRQVL